MENIFSNFEDNKNKLKSEYMDCSDFLFREAIVSGEKCIVSVLDGMIDSLQLSQMIMDPILHSKEKHESGKELFDKLKLNVLNSLEMNDINTFEDIYYFLSSGFAILIIDGYSKGLALGIQGFEKRSVDEPTNEPDIKGAKECFTETLNDNKATIHRRIKSPRLKTKQLKIGADIKTPVVIAYIDGIADKELIRNVEFRITSAGINHLEEYGELVPFLNTDFKSFFVSVGNTERPDKLCSKLLEGRVAVLVDGSPFAIYVPYLFTDSFSTVDDYNNPPIYASFNRLLKYFSFVIAVMLPGIYVALGSYHQELIPSKLLYTIATAEMETPFPLMEEAIFVLIMYEIMREAGLRLPKAIGHAVSIIGGLVIGDATVNAGLIGGPVLVVVAFTAIASYVVYPIYESISVLRILFILLGGFTGIYGIILGASVILVNISALNPLGVPFSSPVSPLSKKSLGDIFIRKSWKSLIKHNFKIQKLRGADFE